MPSISPELERGRRLVENLAGIRLEPHDLAALASAVEQGIGRTGVAGFEEYCEHLEKQREKDELERLFEQVVNNETYFFREPRHFEVLKAVLPAIRQERSVSPEDPVRVLSAGCSTGEEPYSIAIELADLARRLPGFDFQIVGVDISRKALDLARRATYGDNSFRSAAAVSRRDAWFEPAGDRSYRLVDGIGRKVEFRCLNLNAVPFPGDALGMMDVIFFRNVLIYLSPAARLRVCRNLVSSLRDAGCLFIGTSETLPEGLEGLVAQQVDGVFFWKKGRRAKRLLAPGIPDRPRREISSPPADIPGSQAAAGTAELAACAGAGGRPPRPSRPEEWKAWYAEAVEMIRAGRFREAMERLDRVVRRVPDHLDACRLLAELHLDRAEFGEALRLSDQAFEIDPTLAWPHVLQGRVSHYQGDAARAQKELKMAIYYQPGYWPAHFYLAEIYRALGETSLAVHAYRNALRNLDRETGKGAPATDLIGYSRTDIAITCRMNLRSLAGDAAGECLQATDDRRGAGR